MLLSSTRGEEQPPPPAFNPGDPVAAAGAAVQSCPSTRAGGLESWFEVEESRGGEGAVCEIGYRAEHRKYFLGGIMRKEVALLHM